MLNRDRRAVEIVGDPSSRSHYGRVDLPPRNLGHDKLRDAQLARSRSLSVCSALEPSELEDLDRLSQVKQYPAEAVLFYQGAQAAAVFNVTEGVVRLYKSLHDGRRQIVGFALPGDFLGLAMMHRYGVAAEAVSPVRACRFARSAFLSFLRWQAVPAAPNA